MIPKPHIHLWLPVRVGEVFLVDMSHVSEHALLCLGQSPWCNFLLSQAVGFLSPNPERVVSSTPGIFRGSLKPSQAHTGWGGVYFSPDRLAVGLVVSQDG